MAQLLNMFQRLTTTKLKCFMPVSIVSFHKAFPDNPDQM